jgi:hypothetical protein
MDAAAKAAATTLNSPVATAFAAARILSRRRSPGRARGYVVRRAFARRAAAFFAPPYHDGRGEELAGTVIGSSQASGLSASAISERSISLADGFWRVLMAANQ